MIGLAVPRLLLRPTLIQCCVSRSAWKFKRYNPLLLGESRESQYIVGPYIKDFNPNQPILETRIKYDDVYIDIKNTDNDPKPPLKVILMQNIPLLGIRGEILEVECELARYKLIPSKKAVYASPKNLELYKELIEKSKFSPDAPSSKISQLTLINLEKQFILLVMNRSKPWTIQPSHIRIAFRMAGIRVPDYAIELPENPITGPDMEKNGKDFVVSVTINKNPREKAKVRVVLYHSQFEIHDYWYRLQPRKAILSEQQEILDSMFMHEAYHQEEEKVLFE